MSRPIGISVLGSTGSVGSQTLEVIRAYPERYRAVGLCAARSVDGLAQQIEEFQPEVAALADEGAAFELRRLLGSAVPTRILGGQEALDEVASLPAADTVVAAVVGSAGLRGVVAAAKAGKRIALANKEALVMAGEIVVGLVRQHGASLVPVDSEHASLAQLLEGVDRSLLRRVILTASGGPFLGMAPEERSKIKAADALAHPNWEMGAKISVDSASMMNKGFEVIEARWLFDLAAEKIDVLVHPESLVHALLELADGSCLAHLGQPDMRLPIAWALATPGRLDLGERLDSFSWLDLAQTGRLTFLPADEDLYPALGLCRSALDVGGGAPAALSVADEVAVDAFLSGRILFDGITELLAGVLEAYEPFQVDSLDAVIEAGERGRALAVELVNRKG